MKLNPHLNFNGQCAAAFRFYERYLGAKTLFMLTNGASPMAKQFAAEYQDKIMHATLDMGGTIVMGSDCPPGSYEIPKGFTLALSPDKQEEAERIFQALAENGKVIMPLQETFWAARFGMLVDQFGIPWMVNYGKATPSS